MVYYDNVVGSKTCGAHNGPEKKQSFRSICRLIDVVGRTEIEVCRDGSFHNLGFLSDDYPHMLVFLDDARFIGALRRHTNISAVLTTPELRDDVPRHMALGICRTPRLEFSDLHNQLAEAGFYWEDFDTFVDPLARVHPTACLPEANVRIGPRSILGPHVVVLERCLIGSDVTVGAGAVLGGVGFQTVRASHPMTEMRHAGGLTIHDHAHVLPGAVIATGLFRQATELSSEVRAGARCFISHGVRVGARSFVGHGAVVNGNVTLGDDVWVGPGAVIANNISVGDHASVSLGAVVIRDVPPGAQISGNFAIPHRRLLSLLAEMECTSPAE